MGLLAGVVAFAVVPADMAVRLVAGSIVALGVFAVTLYLVSRPGGNMRTQAFYRERLGGDGPFTCEVELTSAGVVSRQLGQESYHAWSHVASVSEVPGGIEFAYTPVGSLLVRDRAFTDAHVRADFVSLARSHIPESAPSSAAPERAPDRPVAAGPMEREYFVAWLLFFVCVSITGNLASAAIGSGAAVILRIPGATPLYGAYIFAALSFIVTACLSYVFFRLFSKRLVTRVQARE